ncbi:hypothetical protein RHMOL_Rhmol03G0052300 [Rhododendron molle]|uniref:Uncharacterized protein n=1 Tax=Rhododendron molle TaxID=49168 RepID=A0ACC0PBW7_RHOML|nr:hypothetical protein RHMOL_Rhmol03G0052300 [Rhododendron molle]
MDCEDLVPEEYQKMEEIPEPKVGMSFDSEDKARDYYSRYAKMQGYVVFTRTSNKRGPSNLSWLAKDARNYGDKVRRLELKEGDAKAMHKYFIKMKADNEAFFYAMDLDEENRLKNVFWADARSREAFKEFGDVVTFDTTYLVNKWNMPFAPFVGVNHHGQSALFGCGLILQEDTDSFVCAVYDSLTKEECEKNWANLINTYHLEANEWLSGLYEERHRWAPAFVKDVFWAGMSTTQRSESMNAYFDGYVHSNTTLKEFVEQYDNALRNKVQKEEEEDARCFNKQAKNVSPYGFEDQFQDAYTLAKCKDFQTQVAGKIACSFTSMKVATDGILKFGIEEDIKVGEKGFLKTGIVCKHIVMVWSRMKLNEVPEKYILQRWSKNVRRSYTRVKVSYANWERKPEWRRYDLMLVAFRKAADKAMDFEAKSKRVVAKLEEAKVENEVCEEECLNNRPMSIDRVDRIISSKEKTIAVGDPTKRRRQGRPSVNRKQPRIEKIIRKIKQSSKNGKASRGNAKNKTVLLDNMDVELPKVHTMEVDEVIMQGSVNCSTFQMVGSHGGMWSYDLDEPSTNL